MSDNEEYISTRDTLSRLVRLETKVCLKFEEMEKALVIAREGTKNELDKAFSAMNIRLEGMNEFRRQIDKAEGKYATKDEVDGVKRLLYIGIGFLTAIELLLRYWR